MSASFLLDSNKIMSMACGLVDTQPLNTLFEGCDFSNEAAAKQNLNSSDPKKVIAAMVGAIIIQELRTSQFTIDKNTKLFEISYKSIPRLFSGPTSNGWRSFFNTFLMNDIQFIDTRSSVDAESEIQDMIPDFSDFSQLKGKDNSKATLIVDAKISQNDTIQLIETDIKDVGYIIYSPNLTSILAGSTASNIKHIIDTYTPANKKLNKISDLHPQLLAKTISESLSSIQKELKDCPDKNAYLKQVVESLYKEISQASSDIASPSYNFKEKFNLISIETLSLFKASKVPDFPNEISLKLNELLSSFEVSAKSSVELCDSRTLLDSDKKIIAKNFYESADFLAETLSELNRFVNVNKDEVSRYGFSMSDDGVFKFTPDKDSTFMQVPPRQNPLPLIGMSVKAVAVTATNVVLITVVLLELVIYAISRFASINAELKAKEAAILEAKAKVLCAENKDSENCVKAKLAAELATAEADAYKNYAAGVSNQSLLNNIMTIFNKAAQQLPAIVNTFLWVAGLGITAVAAKKLWDYSKHGAED